MIVKTLRNNMINQNLFTVLLKKLDVDCMSANCFVVWLALIDKDFSRKLKLNLERNAQTSNYANGEAFYADNNVWKIVLRKTQFLFWVSNVFHLYDDLQPNVLNGTY